MFIEKDLTKKFIYFRCFFGFGFYLSSLSWITNSLTFDDNFKILIPFALTLIPLFLSLFVVFPILLIGPYLKLDFPSLLIFFIKFSFFRLSKSKDAYRLSLEYLGLQHFLVKRNFANIELYRSLFLQSFCNNNIYNSCNYFLK